jgi:hypothetical protein
MEITLKTSRFGHYEIVPEKGESILVQVDYDYPSLANTFGWNICSAQVDVEKPCDHLGTDGTVDCTCGVSVSDFIASAIEYLDSNDGKKVEDPGYFID